MCVCVDQVKAIIESRDSDYVFNHASMLKLGKYDGGILPIMEGLKSFIVWSHVWVVECVWTGISTRVCVLPCDENGIVVTSSEDEPIICLDTDSDTYDEICEYIANDNLVWGTGILD